MLIPVITEKSLGRVETLNEYTFAVPRNTTKSKVRYEVEKAFKVKVLSVRTKVKAGKSKRAGKLRRLVLHAETKQVIVKLDKKNKIDLFEIKDSHGKKG